MLHAEQFFEDFLFGPLWHCSVAAAEPGHTGHSLWLEKSQFVCLLDLCQMRSIISYEGCNDVKIQADTDNCFHVLYLFFN